MAAPFSMSWKDFVKYHDLQYRDAQQKISDAVVRSVINSKPAVIDAGTGIGKTFAYLYPLCEAIQQGSLDRIYITVSTRNLQNQIMEHDIKKVIDFIQKKYGDEAAISMSDVHVVYGANNYLCEENKVFDPSLEEYIKQADMFRKNTQSQKQQQQTGKDKDKKEKGKDKGKIEEDQGKLLKLLNTKDQLIDAIGIDNYNWIVNKIKEMKSTKAEPFLRDEMPFKVKKDLWDKLCCKGKSSCPYSDVVQSQCSYNKDRLKMASRKIVIINHHLLKANHYILHGIWKNGKSYLVVDEAHDFVKTFSSGFSDGLNISTLIKSVDEVATQCKEVLKNLNATNFVSELQRLTITDSSADPVKLESKIVAFSHLKDSVLESIELVSRFVEELSQAKSRIESIQTEVEEQLADSLKRGIDYILAEPAVYVNLDKRLQKIRDCGYAIYSNLGKIEEFIQKTKDIDANFFINYQWAVMDLIDLQDRLAFSVIRKARTGTSQFFRNTRRNRNKDALKDIYIFEYGAKKTVVLKSAPLNHKRLVRSACKQFYKSLDNRILYCSATLTVPEYSKKGQQKRSFESFLSFVGLEDKKEWAILQQYVSPFEYKKQGLLIIPSDFPTFVDEQGKENHKLWYTSENKKAWIDYMVNVISSTVPHISGNSIVMCSTISESYEMTRMLREKLKNTGIKIMNQHEGSFIQQIRELRAGYEPKKLLIGTNLWEGVDLPGGALRGIFMVKSPFPHKDDPISKERAKRWKRWYGKPYFNDIVIPMVANKLTQGSGRLIRNGDVTNEYGVLVFFDPRINRLFTKSKRYGVPPEFLINSLQPFNKKILSSEAIPIAVKQFMEEKVPLALRKIEDTELKAIDEEKSAVEEDFTIDESIVYDI